jgi:hypothetical protein
MRETMTSQTQARKDEMMDYSNLKVGQRVYYTGDMANLPAWCTIVRRNEDPRWGLSYDLRADEEKEIRFCGIRATNFSGIGRRFQVKEEYDAERAIKIAAMRDCAEAVASAHRTS